MKLLNNSLCSHCLVHQIVSWQQIPHLCDFLFQKVSLLKPLKIYDVNVQYLDEKKNSGGYDFSIKYILLMLMLMLTLTLMLMLMLILLFLFMLLFMLFMFLCMHVTIYVVVHVVMHVVIHILFINIIIIVIILIIIFIVSLSWLFKSHHRSPPPFPSLHNLY